MNRAKKTFTVLILISFLLPTSLVAARQVGSIEVLRNEINGLTDQYKNKKTEIDRLKEEYRVSGDESVRQQINVLIGLRIAQLIEIDLKRLEIAKIKMGSAEAGVEFLLGEDAEGYNTLTDQREQTLAKLEKLKEKMRAGVSIKYNPAVTDLINSGKLDLVTMKEIRDELIKVHKTLVNNLMNRIAAGYIYTAHKDIEGLVNKLKYKAWCEINSLAHPLTGDPVPGMRNTILPDFTSLYNANPADYVGIENILRDCNVFTEAEAAFREFSKVSYDTNLKDTETFHSAGKLHLDKAKSDLKRKQKASKTWKLDFDTWYESYGGNRYCRDPGAVTLPLLSTLRPDQRDDYRLMFDYSYLCGSGEKDSSSTGYPGRN